MSMSEVEEPHSHIVSCFGCGYLLVPHGMKFILKFCSSLLQLFDHWVDLYGFCTVSLRKELDLELAFAWFDLGQLKKCTNFLSHVGHVYSLYS